MEFTIMCDEWLVVDVNDGFLFFWSADHEEAERFQRVNCCLDVMLLHV